MCDTELGAINNKRRAETLGQQLRIVEDSEMLAEFKTGRSQSIESRKTVVEGASEMDQIFVGKDGSQHGQFVCHALDGASNGTPNVLLYLQASSGYARTHTTDCT